MPRWELVASYKKVEQDFIPTTNLGVREGLLKGSDDLLGLL
jgi:hypothetical protein